MGNGVNVGRICGKATDDSGIFIVSGDYHEVTAGMLKEILIFVSLNLSRMDIWDKKKHSTVMAKMELRDSFLFQLAYKSGFISKFAKH